MRITEAAEWLGTSPRMLRYRDMLGLLPPVRDAAPARDRAGAPPDQGQARAAPAESRAGAPPDQGQARAAPAGSPARGGLPRGHRRFADDDLAAVAHALRIEQRYDI